MKNAELEKLFKEECDKRGLPTLIALETLARTSDKKRVLAQADMLAKKRQHVMREAMAAAQSKLYHKEEA